MALVNGRFLTECFVFSCVVLFFLFASNRVLGRIVTGLLRTGTWLTRRNVYIHIESIQFSVLGGRLLFKDVRYKSRNQSIHVVKGHITFRYWLYKARKPHDEISQNRGCRLLIRLDGVQWYAYNRTAAYDALLAEIDKRTNIRHPFDSSRDPSERKLETTVTKDKDHDPAPKSATDGFLGRLLPLEVEIHRGSVVLGNQYIPTLLVADFHTGRIIYDIGRSKSKHDLSRTEFDISFRLVKMHLRPNKQFTETLLHHAEHSIPSVNGVYSAANESGKKPSWRRRFFEPKVTYEWTGLDRYQSAQEPDQESIEYAKVENILDAPELFVLYYYDTPGQVPRQGEQYYRSEEFSEIDVGNNDAPPEFGVDITVRGGNITYGPWAERQRKYIQELYFPPAFYDSEPTKTLSPGDERVYMGLKVNLMLDGTELRIPTREPSKEFTSTIDGSSKRPCGWINIKPGPKSCIFWNLPYVADERGWGSFVDIRLYDLEVLTSVNSYKLAEMHSCRIKCDLRNPLAWKAQRDWIFTVTTQKSRFCILRDHVYLLTDLVKDFIAGPTTDISHFVPYTYTLKVSLIDFEIHLYVNDQNILPSNQNDPGVSILYAKSPRGHFEMILPFVEFDQESNSIPFTFDLSDGTMGLSLANWATHQQFLTDRTRDFGRVDEYKLKGSYKYYKEFAPHHVETVTLNMEMSNVDFKVLGFVIRYCLVIRENYAASFHQHVSSENYSRIRRAQEIEARIEAQRPPADTFEVVVTAFVKNGKLQFPTTLYDCDGSLVATIDELQVDCRNVDSYLDLYVNLFPLKIFNPLDNINASEKSSALIIDDLNIIAHRLFGPLPQTLTYICNWEIQLGRMHGQVMPNLLEGLANFGAKFGDNFLDLDNAMATEYQVPTDPDMTFLKFIAQPVDICIWGKDSALQFSVSEGLSLDYDDFMQDTWSSKVILSVPNLSMRGLAIAQGMDIAPAIPAETSWVEIADVKTGFKVLLYNTAANLKARRDTQQAYVIEQDSNSGRARFLYSSKNANTRFHFGPIYSPAMQTPRISLLFQASTNESTSSLIYKDTASEPFWARHQGSYLPFNRSSTSLPLSLNGSSIGSSHDASVVGKSLSEIYSSAFATVSAGRTEYFEELANSEHGADDGKGDITSSEDSDDLASESAFNGDGFPEMSSSFHMTPQSIPYGAYLRKFKLKADANGARFDPMFSDVSTTEDVENLSARHKQREKSKEDWLQIPYGFKAENEVVSTCDIDIIEPLEIMISPIFLKTLKDFLEGFAVKEKGDPAGILDNLQLALKEKLAPISNNLHTRRLRIALEHIAIHSIQDVAISEDFRTMFADPDDIKSRLYDSDSILCVADFIITDVQIQIASTSGLETSAEVKFANLQMDTRFITNSNASSLFGIPIERQIFAFKRIRSVSATEPVVLDLSIEKLHLAFKSSNTSQSGLIHLDRFDFLAIDRSAEILIGAAFSWMVFAEELEVIMDKVSNGNKHAQKVLVTELVKFSMANDIKADDALYDKPSYLLPANGRIIRYNPGWRFICGLRTALRSMSEEQYSALLTSLTASLVSDLSQTGQDLFNGDYLFHDNNPILEIVFGRPEESSPHHDAYFAKSTQMSLRVSLILVRVYESNFENSIRIGPVEVDVDAKTREENLDSIFEDVVSSEARIRAKKALSESNNQNYICCIVRGRCHGINAELNPNLLALTKHLIRVQRLLDSKFSEIQLKNLKMKRSPFDVTRGSIMESTVTSRSLNLFGESHAIVHGIFSLDAVSITAEANNLEVLMQFRDANASYMYYNRSPVQTSDITPNNHPSTKGSQRTDNVRGRLLQQNLALQVKTFSILARDQGVPSSVNAVTGELMFVELNDFGANVSYFIPEGAKTSRRDQVHIFMAFGNIGIDIPQNLLKLYHFANKWRSENLADYDFLFKKLMTEWEEANAPKLHGKPDAVSIQPRAMPNVLVSVNAQLLIRNFTFSSRLLPSLTFEFESCDWMGMVHNADLNAPSGQAEVCLTRQEIRLITLSRKKSNESGARRQSSPFIIPRITFSGKLVAPDMPKASISDSLMPRVPYLDSSVTLDFAELTLNVGIIDNLFTVQSRLSSELNDLMKLFLYQSRKRQQKRQNFVPPSLEAKRRKQAVVTSPPIAYLIRFSQRGFSIAIEGPSSVAFFETDDLSGLITNASRNGGLRTPLMTAWKFVLQDLSLSINHILDRRGLLSDERKYRLAYIDIDLTMQNFRPGQGRIAPNTKEDILDFVYLSVDKIHMVMQPTAIGKFGDLYVHYSQELIRRGAQKQAEIAVLTHNTKEILMSLDVDYKTYKDRGPSFLEKMSIYISINRVGIGVPLHFQNELTENATPGPALLISAESIGLLTKQWQSSMAKIDGFIVQFVEEFDQVDKKHFAARHHVRTNKVVLPNIHAEGQVLEKSTDLLNIRVEAKIGGLIVEVDSTVIGYVNELMDVYLESVKRIERFTLEAIVADRPREESSKSIQPASKNMFRLEVESHVDFGSSTIMMFSLQGDDLSRTKSDQLVLPGLSTWTKFNGRIDQGELRVQRSDRKQLHVEIVIYPSENILYPTIIPFLHDCLHGIKLGILRRTHNVQSDSDVPLEMVPDQNEQVGNDAETLIRGMDISLYFRLSNTKFTITCEPAERATLTFDWKEGNFLIASGGKSTSQHSITCVGMIRGASGSLKHSFQSGDCIHTEISNIIFNTTVMSKDNRENDNENDKTFMDNIISIIVDLSEAKARFDIRFMQYLFVMKSIWIDGGLDKLALSSETSTQTSSPIMSRMKTTTPATIPFSLFIAARVQLLDLSADLGPSIGASSFKILNTTIDYRRIPNVIKGLMAGVDEVVFDARGRLAGNAKIGGIAICSEMKPLPEDIGDNAFVHLLETSWDIASANASLEYEFSKLLVFESDPLHLDIADSWSVLNDSGGMQLELKVTGGMNSLNAIMSVRTIPTVYGLLNKLQMLVDEKAAIAERLITAKSNGKSMKSSIQTAKSTFEAVAIQLRNASGNIVKNSNMDDNEECDLVEDENMTIPSDLSLIGNVNVGIKQMSVTIFRSHFYEPECIQIYLRKCSLNLNREPESHEESEIIMRLLSMELGEGELFLSTMLKISNLDEQNFTQNDWFEHVKKPGSVWKIVNIPKTIVEMKSWQNGHEPIVRHVFKVDFDGPVGVAFNLQHLAYLIGYWEMFEREMKKAKVQGNTEVTLMVETPNAGEEEFTESIIYPGIISDESVKLTSMNEGNEGNEDAVTIRTLDSFAPEPVPSRVVLTTHVTTRAKKEEKKEEQGNTGKSSPPEGQDIEFHAIEPVVLNPKLRLLGDATPPLEWFGWKRALIPGYVHRIVTMNLDDGLEIMYGLYAQQLEKAVSRFKKTTK